MNRCLRMSAAVAAIISAALLATGPSTAAGNPAVEALQHTPVSLFTYGLNGIGDAARGTFVRDDPPPFAKFAAPLSGKMADIVTVLYAEDTDTITINLVKIEKLADGATRDDACKQVIAALRMFAGLDPVTGQLPAGMTSSSLASGFLVTGSPVKGPADDLATLDKAFQFRFNGQTATGARFTCKAPMFGTDYTLDSK